MKKFLYLVALAIFLTLAITFTIHNPQSISIKYYLGISWHGPVIVLVLVSLGIGIVVGSLSGWVTRIRLRRTNSRLRKENELVLLGTSESKDLVYSKKRSK